MLSGEGGVGTEEGIEYGYLEIDIWLGAKPLQNLFIYLFLMLNKYADQMRTVNKI